MDGWLSLCPWKGLDRISCRVTFPKCQSEIQSAVKLAAWESSPGGPSPAHGLCLTQTPAALTTTDSPNVVEQIQKRQHASMSDVCGSRTQPSLKICSAEKLLVFIHMICRCMLVVI